MIFEDAEAGDFFCQIVCIGVGVFLSHAEQNQQSHADLTADPSVDRDLRPAHALDDGTHATLLASH
jgi:hypothetical protein